ncbi:MAG: hypothetical protein JW940_06765 [Polyangiaceae bacterium]|nr:hypothetical protein [Polyangiaceae bacterium]
MWRHAAPRPRFGAGLSKLCARGLLATISAACLGCTGVPRTAAHFAGHSRPRLVGPEQIQSVTDLATDYDSLGEVSAHCTRVAGERRMDDEWLSDVACSAELLRSALRTRAAEVGGTLLVDERCSSRPDSVSSGPRVSCRALVAAPDRAEPSRTTVPLGCGGAGPEPERSPSLAEVWNTRVEFTPARPMTARGQRRADLVAELPRLPVDHVLLGDVVAHCEAGCSLGGARDAVRLVAASIGADAVADVRCVRERLGWLCSGRATAYEHQPAWSGGSP